MTGKDRRFQVQSTQPGGSVLDELTGGGQPRPEPAPALPAAEAPRQPRAAAPAAALARTPIRVQVPVDLADRVRGAVAALAYQVPAWSSLNAATTAALEQFVTDAETEYNGGERFPWDPGRQLQPGRRVGQ